MIKLEQVSTALDIKYLSYKFRHNHDDLAEVELERKKCYESLKYYNVTNYGQLKELVESGNPDFQYDYFKSRLMSVEISILQSSNAKLVVYPTDDYESVEFDRERLIRTDLANKGDVLLFDNILKLYGVKKGGIRYYSIHELKQMLNNVVVDNYAVRIENALVNNIRGFGHTSAQKLRDSINFYEQQVVRQANEYRWSEDENLFLIDKDYRLEATKEQIDEIIMYLSDNAEECIWGILTQSQKESLIKAVKGSKKRECFLALSCIINNISNYVTLGELEEGLVRTRVINRFIKKKIQ